MESISIFDIFKIGVGPSSSHTMGPWRAAQRFLKEIRERGKFDHIARIRVDLYGSLAKTGKGHGTDLAVLMGLAGEDPVSCDVPSLHAKVAAIRSGRRMAIGRRKSIPFDPSADLVFHGSIALPFHPNGLTFSAWFDDDSEIAETYYSVGGGFVVQEGKPAPASHAMSLPRPIEKSADLLRYCRRDSLSIPEIVWQNELTWRSPAEIRDGLCRLWSTMKDCVWRGCQTEGILPGGLHVVRRAAKMSRSLLPTSNNPDVDTWIAAIRSKKWSFADTVKWVSLFALAVNEENAAFGRVVTAPTNGAAGVIPAVMMYYACFCEADEQGIEAFFLTSAEIGSLFKKGATISAAMGGCQAEIGVSSAMAAAGLTQVLGGTVDQVLMAAEIAMEHHLGMTCDPVGGLVQVPCIERNTMGAIKAITASQLALANDPSHAKVSLDDAIRSMWATAQDMNVKYKETSEGGLAVLIPVNVSEC